MQHYRDFKTFDGLDNRREVMILLGRLDSDEHRIKFLKSLMPRSHNAFAMYEIEITGPCDPVSAYFIFISICNELGVSIIDAAQQLEMEVKRASARSKV